MLILLTFLKKIIYVAREVLDCLCDIAGAVSFSL